MAPSKHTSPVPMLFGQGSLFSLGFGFQMPSSRAFFARESSALGQRKQVDHSPEGVGLLVAFRLEAKHKTLPRQRRESHEANAFKIRLCQDMLVYPCCYCRFHVSSQPTICGMQYNPSHRFVSSKRETPSRRGCLSLPEPGTRTPQFPAPNVHMCRTWLGIFVRLPTGRRLHITQERRWGQGRGGRVVWLNWADVINLFQSFSVGSI